MVLFVVLSGQLFGIIGFLLSVPVFVVIYTTLKEYIEARLTKKGYSLKNPAEEFHRAPGARLAHPAKAALAA